MFQPSHRGYFPIMDIRRNLLLLFLYIAAANSFPNLVDDWGSQNLNSDSIASSGLGFLDIGLSEPQDNTNFYFNDDESLSISGNPVLADPGVDGATISTFQDLTGDELSASIAGLDDGDATLSFPAIDAKGELAMDDICPLGYWNRCCNGGACFWGRIGLNLAELLANKCPAPTPVLKAICADSQLWCCYARPVSPWHPLLLTK